MSFLHRQWSARVIGGFFVVAAVVTLAGCGSESGIDGSTDQPRPLDLLVRRSVTGTFAPADGKTLLFIGQDSGTIADYAAAVPEHRPVGITLYTGLRAAEPGDTLDGIEVDSGDAAGSTSFDESLVQFPDAALAVGLSIHDAPTCESSHTGAIAAGEYDESLGQLVAYLAGLAPRPVFLRIGYEFDGPWNCHRPREYVAAFRYIAAALDSVAADNVVTVWQSANWPDPGIAASRVKDFDHQQAGHLDRWYPGDDVVDWIGMSVFFRDASGWGYEPPAAPARLQAELISFARQHGKPIMIAEAAPQGYRIGALTRSSIHSNSPSAVTPEEIWSGWYEPFFSFVHANRDVVRAVAYINTHWESQPMWRCEQGADAGTEGCPEGNWGDSRVQANPLIKARWLQEILNAERWNQAPAWLSAADS
jgi:hypothetical protein